MDWGPSSDCYLLSYAPPAFSAPPALTPPLDIFPSYSAGAFDRGQLV